MRGFLVAVLAGSALLLALLWVGQRRLIYFPYAGLAPAVSLGLPSAQDVTFTTDDGVRLHGWFVPTELAAGRICPRALLSHGSNILWLEGTTSGSIRRMASTGGAITTLASGIANLSNRLLTDGTNLYFSRIDFGGNTCSVHRMPLNGGSPQLLSESNCNNLTFTLSSGLVHYGFHSSDFARLRRISVDGGAVTTTAILATPFLVFDLVVVGGRVIFGSGLNLYSASASGVSAVPTSVATGIQAVRLATDGTRCTRRRNSRELFVSVSLNQQTQNAVPILCEQRRA